jgi:signal transduction histidine kinase
MSSVLAQPANSQATKFLTVLLVEDSEADALLLVRALHQGGYKCKPVRVAGREAMEEALSAHPFDLILCDHSMPRFSAPEALELVKSRNLDVPFIIVSGHIEEQTAVDAMRGGAHDYVMKDRLARLVPAVERELREADMRRAQREYQAQLQRAQEELEARVEERTADLRAANRKLQQVLEERRRLENELLEIAENERRRIGFDLHDDLGQKLTGASLMIKALEHKLSTRGHPAAGDAKKIHGLVDQIIQHTHNLAHQCSSLNATGQDICSVLQSLATNVRKMFNVTCEFTARGAAPELPSDAMLQLHKIAQEAVSNAIKHGRAENVCIGLDRNGHNLTLSIKNDGVPFSPPAGPTTRMGLRIMNYRANTIGGTLEIKPEKEGTLVTCTLPLQNGHSARQRSAAGKGARKGLQNASSEPAMAEHP